MPKIKGKLESDPGSWRRVSLFLRSWQVDELLLIARRLKVKGAASAVTQILYRDQPQLMGGEQLDLMGTAPAIPAPARRARKKAAAKK